MGNLGAAHASGITALLAASFGWRAAFILSGLVCLVVGIAFTKLVPDDGDPQGKSGSADKIIPVVRARECSFCCSRSQSWQAE